MKGLDARVKVPMGTVVYCNATGECIGEISHTKRELVVALGGVGGKGNSAPTQRVRGEKSVATPPTRGERKWLRLELKLVADIGTVASWPQLFLFISTFIDTIPYKMKYMFCDVRASI